MKPRLARHPGVALLLLALMLTPFVAACGANGDDDPGVATLDDSGDSSDEESDDADDTADDLRHCRRGRFRGTGAGVRPVHAGERRT